MDRIVRVRFGSNHRLSGTSVLKFWCASLPLTFCGCLFRILHRIVERERPGILYGFMRGAMCQISEDHNSKADDVLVELRCLKKNFRGQT